MHYPYIPLRANAHDRFYALFERDSGQVRLFPNTRRRRTGVSPDRPAAPDGGKFGVEAEVERAETDALHLELLRCFRDWKGSLYVNLQDFHRHDSFHAGRERLVGNLFFVRGDHLHDIF